jgi:hypothetical protein
LQVYATAFIQRLNLIKQSILPNYIFIPEAPAMTFDSFTGLQRMITVQLSFTLVVPTNCEPVVSKLVECIANIVTSSNLTASLTTVIKLVSSLQASSSLSASALVSKLAASSLTGAGTLAADLTVGGAFDADAQAFFNRVTTAGGILSATEQNAVNTLVIALKADGIWDKMQAIYPMVGASAAACAQNLKSSSFTGTFTAGWTFASEGVTGNGTSAFMNTNLTPSVSLVLNNTHLSFYSRSNSPASSMADIGSFGSNSSWTLIEVFGSIFYNLINQANSASNSSMTTTLGHFVGSRTASNNLKSYRNGTSFATHTTSSNNLSDRIIYLAAMNNSPSPQFYSNRQYSFASIGDGLNDIEVANFYTDVQAFQTTLSRQV